MSLPIRLPKKCCWNCKYAIPWWKGSILDFRRHLNDADRRSMRCLRNGHDAANAHCPALPTSCYGRCRGGYCGHWMRARKATPWLKGKENTQVPGCEHDWHLVGMAMPHFVEWCPHCGSIRKTTQRESGKRVRWSTIWDEKCKHNPKRPRVLLEIAKLVMFKEKIDGKATATPVSDT